MESTTAFHCAPNPILSPPVSGDGTQTELLWATSSSSHTTASSSSSASPRDNGPRVPRKRPGRPPTARRIWQQQVMKRRLIRLYLYTPESILNTKQISQVISAVARYEEQGRSATAGSDILVSNDARTQTETRSTQYELQKLFWEGYRQFRPRDRETARERVQSFRRIRHGRVSKRWNGREPHNDQNRSRPGSVLLSGSASFMQSPVLPAHVRRHRPHQARDETVNNIIRQVNTSDEYEWLPERSDQNYKSSIRLSWVRKKFGDISKQSLSSSVYSDIRSLLSRLSLRTSVSSYRSAAMVTNINVLPVGHEINSLPSDKKAKLITLCCQYRKDCIHRKFLQTTDPLTLPVELRNEGLCREDFTIQHGRDIWNSTAFHLAAEWASDELAIPLIQEFIDQRLWLCQCADPYNPGPCPDTCKSPYLHRRVPDILNIKNIDGDTFMHVLARRWCKLLFPPHMTAASFCWWVIVGKFDLSLCDHLGRTFFGCLVAQMRFSWSRNEAEHTLRSFGWELIIILSEAGLPSDCRAFVSDILQGADLWTASWVPRATFTKTMDRGANVDKYDEDGRTYLMTLIDVLQDPASTRSALEQVKIYISYQPDLNLLDHGGNTALHYAVQAGCPQVVELLINSGINIDACNLQGLSAMDLAVVKYDVVAQPSGSDLGGAYARVHGILVRLFDSAKGRWQKRVF
ncbi:ankyrin [Xylariaceae sp. AK1471]|nr:ankyrin [Xylariaceae sp. AK1471]